jgi:enoyl-CoA hydratase
MAVRLEKEGLVGVIVLDRPPANSYDYGFLKELGAAIDAARWDEEVRAVAVTSASERFFSGGADVKAFQTASLRQRAMTVVLAHEVFRKLENTPLVFVAAIAGHALGGGLELALACDLRVAESTARLGVPEIKLGLLPGAAGTARLTRILPPCVAKQLLLTGEPLGAADAHRLGLVNEVVDEGTARVAAVRLAARLAELPPLALAAGKRLVDEGGQMPLDAAVAFERETVAMLFGTDDRAEGIRAFLDKRPPSFTGR